MVDGAALDGLLLPNWDHDSRAQRLDQLADACTPLRPDLAWHYRTQAEVSRRIADAERKRRAEHSADFERSLQRWMASYGARP